MPLIRSRISLLIKMKYTSQSFALLLSVSYGVKLSSHAQLSDPPVTTHCCDLFSETACCTMCSDFINDVGEDVKGKVFLVGTNLADCTCTEASTGKAVCGNY